MGGAEEVREIKYLGVILGRRGGLDGHVRERVRKARRVMGAVWGLGERLCGGDMGMREMLFRQLVRGVLMYGVELWGWKERRDVEAVQVRYWRWVLGLGKEVPDYLVRSEAGIEKLRVWMTGAVVKAAERVRGLGCALWRGEGEAVWWTREAGGENLGNLAGRLGWGREEIERIWAEGGSVREMMMMREREICGQEERGKIDRGRYMEIYSWISGGGRPKYLEGGLTLKEKRIVARFRCGMEFRGGRYWMTVEDRSCRLCGAEEETV